MKKAIYFLMTLSLLFTVGCAKEDVNVPVEEQYNYDVPKFANADVKAPGSEGNLWDGGVVEYSLTTRAGAVPSDITIQAFEAVRSKIEAETTIQFVDGEKLYVADSPFGINARLGKIDFSDYPASWNFKYQLANVQQGVSLEVATEQMERVLFYTLGYQPAAAREIVDADYAVLAALYN